MRFSDTMLGLMVLVFGLAMGSYAITLPAIPGQHYGAATFPLVIAAGFVACAAVLVVSGLRSRGVPLVAFTLLRRRPGAMGALGVTAACVVAYVLLAHRIGFVPMSIAILLIMFRMLGVDWRKAIVVALIATFVIDYVFRSILLVPLPFGIMPRLPW